MIITGRFIGETSCGFIHGHVYRIRIMWLRGYIWITDAAIGSSRTCPYSDIQAVAANWEIPAVLLV